MAIQNVIRRFMELIDDEQQLADAECRLGALLDELAFEITKVECAFVGDDRDAPTPSCDEVRARVVSQFPDLDLYNTPATVTINIGDAACIVGDCHDASLVRKGREKRRSSVDPGLATLRG